MDQAVFVAVQIDIVGHRGPLFGGAGGNELATGSLHSPGDDLILWRVIERAEVEKKLVERVIAPADDGLSVEYRYVVAGGDGGLFPVEEPGQFKAELVAAFAHPSFLNEVGRVEIITSTVDPNADRGTKAPIKRRNVTSPAQLEGRLVRSANEDRSKIWFIENGKKRLLESPTCGTLRFGDSWYRLIQTLPTDDDAELIADGKSLTLAEAAEGRVLGAWPAPETYYVEDGKKRLVVDPKLMTEKFGEHWKIKTHHLRQDELAAIPGGADLA